MGRIVALQPPFGQGSPPSVSILHWQPLVHQHREAALAARAATAARALHAVPLVAVGQLRGRELDPCRGELLRQRPRSALCAARRRWHRGGGRRLLPLLPLLLPPLLLLLRWRPRSTLCAARRWHRGPAAAQLPPLLLPLLPLLLPPLLLLLR